MICDKITNIGKYPELKKYENKIMAFVEDMEKQIPKPGRYDLSGEELFALVQIYDTKDKEGAYMESHEKYADLQYIHDGEEVIYFDFSDELVIREDQRPDSDMIFYQSREEKGRCVLKKGMFGYYDTQDAHMPCITYKKKTQVIKVVFKIQI